MTKPIFNATTYAQWRATPLGRITEQLETRLVFDLVGSLKGKRVLDLGTGDGTYAIAAANRGALVTALDLEPAMLTAAAERMARQRLSIALHQGRIECLPFQDASFDVVVAVTVLCFVTDTKTALREMVRVLVPGGRLVLGELGRYNVWAAQRRIRGWFGAQRWQSARFWTRAALCELTHDAGLNVKLLRGAIYYPPSSLAATLGVLLDPLLTRMHAPGAAFLAIVADKPLSPKSTQ